MVAGSWQDGRDATVGACEVPDQRSARSSSSRLSQYEYRNKVANESKSNQGDVQMEVVEREVVTKAFVLSLCV
jgi:hypothetical protein